MLKPTMDSDIDLVKLWILWYFDRLLLETCACNSFLCVPVRYKQISLYVDSHVTHHPSLSLSLFLRPLTTTASSSVPWTLHPCRPKSMTTSTLAQQSLSPTPDSSSPTVSSTTGVLALNTRLVLRCLPSLRSVSRSQTLRLALKTVLLTRIHPHQGRALDNDKSSISQDAVCFLFGDVNKIVRVNLLCWVIYDCLFSWFCKRRFYFLLHVPGLEWWAKVVRYVRSSFS